MSRFGILGATALSLTLAVGVPAFAAGPGMHGGGGGGMHGGGGAGMQGGGGGRASFAGGGSAFRGAQASVGPSRMGPVGTMNGGNFARRGFRGDRDHDRRFRPGFGLGFVAGSVLGYGYDPYYDYAYNDYYDDDYPAYPAYVASSAADPAYCAQRYRSYDPATGTYLGYDGQRHPCE